MVWPEPSVRRGWRRQVKSAELASCVSFADIARGLIAKRDRWDVHGASPEGAALWERKQREGWEELAAGQKAERRGQACSGCVKIRNEDHTVSTTAKSEFPKERSWRKEAARNTPHISGRTELLKNGRRVTTPHCERYLRHKTSFQMTDPTLLNWFSPTLFGYKQRKRSTTLVTCWN